VPAVLPARASGAGVRSRGSQREPSSARLTLTY